MTPMPTDTPYSNRELDRIFKSHEEKMLAGFASVTEQISDVVKVAERIEQQTIKTNGRVGQLEQWKENTAGKINGVLGLIKWIGIPLFGLWVGFVSWSTTELLKLKDTARDTPEIVRKAVAEELSDYTFEITTK